MNITERVKKLNFPLGEYVVVGSALLEALQLRSARDIDIAVTQKLFKQLKAQGGWKEEMRKNGSFLVRDDVEVIAVLNWDKYPTTVEEAIQTAVTIDGVPFLNITETVLFKKALGREKDENDILLLQRYQESKKRF